MDKKFCEYVKCRATICAHNEQRLDRFEAYRCTEYDVGISDTIADRSRNVVKQAIVSLNKLSQSNRGLISSGAN